MKQETTEWQDVSFTDKVKGEQVSVEATIRDNEIDDVLICNMEIPGKIIYKLAELINALVTAYPEIPVKTAEK